MQLIIDTANTQISVRNKSFFIQSKSRQQIIGTKRISSIALYSNCNISASALKLAANNQIPVYFYNAFGTLQARLCSPFMVNLAELRRKQLYFYDHLKASGWVIDTLLQKTYLQSQLLLQLSARKKRIRTSIQEKLNKIEQISIQAKSLKHLHLDRLRPKLLGLEGNISKLYFSGLSLLVPQEFGFEKRSRRPALDYFNAGLNYLYGMTYSIVESGIYAKGLDPYTGYMHTDFYRKKSLVFDLIEPVRPLIDKMWMKLILNKEIKPEHFIPKEQGYWLSKEGKRIVIPTFNQYLRKRTMFDGNYYSLKKYIFALSNDLGKLIDETIDLKNVISDNL